ncbi:MAG: T9SS type A sorting domain-containing protein [Flavobacteriales bacterium]|nr:T9SS type A sorting domain-containing protein [Flavobacteriales bacterium]
MKNKNLLIGTLGLGLVAGLMVATPFLSSNELTYSPRQNDNEKPSVDQAMEHYMSKRLDANGVYNPALIKQTRAQFMQALMAGGMNRSLDMPWIEEGPDNVGGRTRAICIDKNNSNLVWAGSVSGGLFVSSNGGNSWGRVDNFDQTLSIASMTQTLNGRLYVGTGFSNGFFFNEAFVGDGLFYTDDLGQTWNQVSGSANEDWVELQADPNNPNKIWCGTSGGLKTYDGATITTINNNGMGTGNCYDVKISKDGNVVACAMASTGVRTYVSTDGGVNFTNVSGTGSTQIPSSGVGRIELAISHEKNSNNAWNLFASVVTTGGGTLKGQYFSEDNGLTWSEIAPSSSPSFDPFISQNGQGVYDNVITVIPGAPEKALLGGIDVYAWERAAGTNPAFGQWEQRSLWFASPLSPIYVHADNHEMEWDQNGILYIGNDGGIGKSPDKGSIFFPANRGYNVTQFYGIGFSADGDVIGGAQDNGTNLNTHTGVTLLSFDQVRGGDGFDCDISHIKEDVIFASVYNGDMQRSDDGGASFNAFFSPPSGSPFHTVGRLWENPNDVNALDSIGVQLGNNNTVTGDILATAGDTIHYFSQTLQQPLYYITPTNIVATHDSANVITLQDRVQSLYAIGLGTEVRVTREALRFSVTPNFRILQTGVVATALEFSHDGEHLYVGTSTGDLYRISGFSTFYAPTYDVSNITVTQIFNGSGGSVDGIGVDMTDPEHVIVTLTGFQTARVLESNTAASTSTTTSFTSIHGNLPNIPVYDAVINVNNTDQAIIGTEFGAYATDNLNGTSTVWTFQSQVNGPQTVPVYSVRQQWRGWDEGTNRPGEVYLGTFGRGIWRSEAWLSVKDPGTDNNSLSNVLPVSIYPNPMQDNGRVSFDMKENGNVVLSVYNLAGQKVQTLSLGQRNAGKQYADINVAELANGTYIVHVQAGKYVHQGKLLIAR